MVSNPSQPVRLLEWIGSSLKDMRWQPKGAQREFGQALYEAQRGGKHPSAKPLKGEAFKGAAVLEIVADINGDTYRVAYTARLEGVIYVLHVFQKKATRGNKTSRTDIDLIRSRLITAKEHHAMNYKSQDTG